MSYKPVERYVSYETAALMKSLGFYVNWCNQWYNNKEQDGHPVSVGFKNCVPAATQQMAMEWIRDIYHILIYVDYNGDIGQYCWAVTDTESGEARPYDGFGDTYPETVENALQYVMKYVIPKDIEYKKKQEVENEQTIHHDLLQKFNDDHCYFCGSQRCLGCFDEVWREGCEKFKEFIKNNK